MGAMKEAVLAYMAQLPSIDSVADMAGLPEYRHTYGANPQQDNNRRASRAAKVVARYAELLDGEDAVETMVADMLTDVLHLLDGIGVDPEPILYRAQHFHAEEVKGEW